MLYVKWYKLNQQFSIIPFIARIEVGFDPITYSVTEGETAMLRIVLSMPFDEEITVSLMTVDGSATGICGRVSIHMYTHIIICMHTHTHTHTHTH